MSYIPTKAEAKELLAKYNKEPFHIRHGEVVSGVLGYFAKEYDPSRVEFWEWSACSTIWISKNSPSNIV